MKLDAHQHFWRYSAAEYPWIPPGSALQQDWLPGDLRIEQAKVALDGSITVQARQSLEESRWLVELAERNADIKGVVGWVDLRSDRVEEQLREFVSHPKFVGVRHVVQDEPDDNFMLRSEFLRGIGKLKQFNLAYDILIYPKQLRAAIELARRFPEQRFVLDHIAKPHIKDGKHSPWAEEISELAAAPNVWCKVSGMITEADHSAWKASDFKPYLDVVFEKFGMDRLMFGSDWPVCLLAGSYERVFKLVADYCGNFSEADKDRLFGGNCAEFYLSR
ncbi:MAG: amidohydrolase [Pedosphaera sp.]|nr:amidohydrolase [Pedosphaera sp.]